MFVFAFSQLVATMNRELRFLIHYMRHIASDRRIERRRSRRRKFRIQAANRKDQQVFGIVRCKPAQLSGDSRRTHMFSNPLPGHHNSAMRYLTADAGRRIYRIVFADWGVVWGMTVDVDTH